MATDSDHGASAPEARDIERAAELLGGSRVLGQRLRTAFDVHEVLSHGLPAAALTRLVVHISVHHSQSFVEPALGMSMRTLQRFKLAPGRPLNKEQSGRAWTLAEILAKATEVFGSQKEAVQWLGRAATGLDQRRPIDLLATPAGVKLVEDFLGRLEYGVYA